MSKHKNHNKNINKNELIDTTPIDESVFDDELQDIQNSEDTQIMEKTEDLANTSEINEEILDVIPENELGIECPKVNDQPVIEEPIQHTIIYRVCVDCGHSKNIPQVFSTSNLLLAKETCINYRNTYNKTYHVFDDNGNVVYTSEYTTPKDNYFRIGTDWKNGICINQKFTCTDFNLACKNADINTKLYGVVYNVYDPSGKIIFSSKKKLTLLSLKKRGNKNDSWYFK